MNTYKVCLIKNRYTGTVDIQKYAIDWFLKYANLDVEFNVIETDFDVTTLKISNNAWSGGVVGADILPKIRTVIPENKYNAVVFLYGNALDEIRLSSVNIDGAQPLYPDTEFINTFKGDDEGKIINHELFHCFFFKAKKLQFNVLDNMDTYIGDKNLIVDNVVDTNREIALQTLKPYWAQICAFRTQTVQPPVQTMQKYNFFSQKEVARFKLVPKVWEIMDIVRGLADLPVIGTSGRRTVQENIKAGGVSNSSHLRGLAFDWLCTDNFKRTKFVKAVLNCGIPVFLEVAKSHLHLDIDSSIHEMGQMIILGDD